MFNGSNKYVFVSFYPYKNNEIKALITFPKVKG